MQSLEQANLQQDLNRSLLRITHILQQCLLYFHSVWDRVAHRMHTNFSKCSGLPSNSQSAIELLLTKPELLNNLRKAHMGNYGVVLSLLGCLEQGLKTKKLADRVIDSCMSTSLGIFYEGGGLMRMYLCRRPSNKSSRRHIHT
jgi:hypothetical protein